MMPRVRALNVRSAMSAATPLPIRAAPWDGFVPGRWHDHVDVRDFIQRNYTPFTGDGAFLCDTTERTRAVWQRLGDLMAQERAGTGVLDVDAATPSSITAHGPGYIDRDRELIVGLQTDAPLKRAIMPNGGWRMVEGGLRAYGFEPDPRVRETFTRHRKTHNDGVFDAYTPEILSARKAGIVTGCPTPTAAAGSSATIAASRCTASTG